METKWTEAIHKTPQPQPGVLTERALAQAPRKSRRTLRPYAYGSLALAATLPVSLFLHKRAHLETAVPRVVASMPAEVVTMAPHPAWETDPSLRHPHLVPQRQAIRQPKRTVRRPQVTLRSLANSQEVKTQLLHQRESSLEESVPVIAEPLSRQARGGVAPRGLSTLSTSSGEWGTQLAFVESTRLAEVEGTSLTPLPKAPAYENPQLKTAVTRWPDGQVEGTLALATPSRGGAIPKTYLVYVAAFDAKGTLISTAQTELPGVGGTASVKLGLAPTAQHYQLALFAKPAPPKQEMVVAGALVRHLAGDVLSSSTSPITLHKSHFYESNYDKTLSANLSVSTVNLGDAAGYTVHGALFDEKGALLSTDQAPLKSEISLGFGVTGRHATRYQLAVTAPTPKPQNSRLGEYLVAQVLAAPATAARGLSVVLKPEQAALVPRVAMRLPDDPENLPLHTVQTQQSLALQPQTARSTFNTNLNLSRLSPLSEPSQKAPNMSMIVASVKTEENGSLLLLPPPCPNSMEEILKNPKLRDYAQIKLPATVVAALKAKGITEFVGKSIEASGKSESVLNLSRPAFEVTTVTVERAEDFSVSQKPMTSFVVATATPEADGALVLRAQPSQYALEEIFKNPKLRDYTQVKLTPSVVAALKARGITEFVGTALEATGKSETSIYLAFPAFEGTTVTVERPEDVLIGIPFQQGQAQDFLRRLREAKDGQGRYTLLISPTFNEVLLAAAQRGDEATVIELVQWSWFGGPDEAAKGGNGVTWAAYCPTVEPVKALLERGVPAGVADASGNTGLHRTYRPEIAELLLKHKALTETKNTEGETPLIAQTRQADRWLGRLGVVQALLVAGAKPNATDNQGRTPLMWAAKSGLPDFVEALLTKGADMKRKDKDGKTARDYIAAWQWNTAPGALTIERAAQLQRDSEADRARVEKLLGGK